MAGALLKVIEREQPGLVILGKQAIDDDNSQTGQMLAALWDRPQATFASKVVLNDGSATVTREVDVGLETIEIDLPAVVKFGSCIFHPVCVGVMSSRLERLASLTVPGLSLSR